MRQQADNSATRLSCNIVALRLNKHLDVRRSTTPITLSTRTLQFKQQHSPTTFLRSAGLQLLSGPAELRYVVFVSTQLNLSSVFRSVMITLMDEDTHRDSQDTVADSVTDWSSERDTPVSAVTDEDTADPDAVILVTTAEAAAMAGVSARTIRRWINRGILAAVETADGYMVSPADIPAAQRAAGHGRPAGTRSDARFVKHDRGGQPYAATVPDTATDAATSALSNQAARQQLEAIREEWLAPLVAQISEQAETIGRLTERSEHQQETIAKLECSRERLETRLQELEWPPDPQPERGSETQQEAVQRPWWRFWML